MKIIFHIDLDSYFVSAEITTNPKLKNKPIVISNGGDRSIISAASYEAKKIGIYVPMPLYKAKEKNSNLIIIKPNFSFYTILSNRVFDFILKKYSKKIRIASIDECYLDVTNEFKKYGKPEDMAKKIQNEIFNKFSLPCSIGISNNEFVAKMSTQINKPMGITITWEKDFLDIFGNWNIEKYYGIGKVLALKMKNIGIKTIGDLAKTNVDKIKHFTGVLSNNFIYQANGYGKTFIEDASVSKGIGNEKTFQNGDKYDRQEILLILENLINSIIQKMKNRNLYGSTVSIYTKKTGDKEIKSISQQKTLKRPTDDFNEIFSEIISLFDDHWLENSIKLIGVRITNLVDKFSLNYQMSLFEEKENKNLSDEIIEKINFKFHNKISWKATELEIEKKSKFMEKDGLSKYFNSNKKNND